MAKVDELKKEYGAIYELSSGEHKAFFKNPDRNALALALSYRAKDKVLEAGEVLLDNCYVGGDKAIVEDEMLRIAASLQIANIVELPDVQVKKL